MQYFHIFTNRIHPKNPKMPEYLGTEYAKDFEEACEKYKSRHDLSPKQLLLNGLEIAQKFMKTNGMYD